MLAPLTDADPRKVGRYSLQGRLGAGGMGTVYLGFDEDGRPMAVKVIRPELIGDTDFRERFRREVAAARRVRGRFVAEVRDADVDAERPWMATEYVDGVSLAAAVGERGRLGGSMLVDLAASLADALAAIHAAGLVHRDLKPSNILLAWDGPKVIDFGVAHAVDTTEHTQTGHIIGTVAWMAPEQLRGERAGPAADIFSWAMCVAFAATGRHLFAADTPTASAIRMLREEPDLSGIPEGLTPLTLRALNRDPGRRPTAVELVTGIVRNYSDSIDLADQVTRRVLVTPPPPPPAASAPVADRAGDPRAAGRTGGPAGHAVVTPPPGHPGSGHSGAVHPGTGHPGTGHAGAMRRWQLALVTVAAGIALGVTAGLVVAVAMHVTPNGNASLPGAMTTPAGVPVPSGNATVPTAGGLWTPGPPASAGFGLARPPGAVAWTLSGQSTSTPLSPSAQPAQPPPGAENVARSSPKEPTAPTDPEPARTAQPPATTTPAKPSQPPPTSPAPAPAPSRTPQPPATTPAKPPPSPPSSAPATSSSGSPSVSTSEAVTPPPRASSTQSVAQTSGPRPTARPRPSVSPDQPASSGPSRPSGPAGQPASTTGEGSAAPGEGRSTAGSRSSGTAGGGAPALWSPAGQPAVTRPPRTPHSERIVECPARAMTFTSRVGGWLLRVLTGGSAGGAGWRSSRHAVFHLAVFHPPVFTRPVFTAPILHVLAVAFGSLPPVRGSVLARHPCQGSSHAVTRSPDQASTPDRGYFLTFAA